MQSDLKGLMKDGWKNNKGMAAFANSLNKEAMQKFMLDPTDPSKQNKVMMKDFQAGMVETFMKIALTSLEKHYDIFCDKLLFLSLYGEQYSSKVVAKILNGQDDHRSNDDDDEVDVVHSEIHGREIDINAFRKFVKSKVDVAAQRKKYHIKQLEADLHSLAGESFSLKILCILCGVVNLNYYSPTLPSLSCIYI